MVDDDIVEVVVLDELMYDTELRAYVINLDGTYTETGTIILRRNSV
jgi:hypothetical protein